MTGPEVARVSRFLCVSLSLGETEGIPEVPPKVEVKNAGPWEQKRRQKSRAVASLETRMRVVASVKDLNFRGLILLYVLVALRSVRRAL